MARVALFPGTFDPVTNGHLALIADAASFFDEVVVCILVNPEKKTLFDEATRLRMLAAATENLPHVRVMSDHGMTADLAKALGATIVRGIRDEKDAEYELPMADFNRERAGVETMFFPAPPETRDISATRVREALRNGEPLTGLVPESVIPLLK